MEKVSVLAITKNGVKIGENLKNLFPDWKIYSPKKFLDEKIKCKRKSD